jgi:hypothetical protein
VPPRKSRRDGLAIALLGLMLVFRPSLRPVAAVLVLALSTAASATLDAGEIINPAIDSPGYLADAHSALAARQAHLISEEDFIRMSQEPGTLILDARSRDKYAELHIKGAVSLPFTDMTIASLEKLIPDHGTRILIYCNNNFQNAPSAFPSKIARASLNLSTSIALYSYGYRNVWELGPLLDVHRAKIEFEPPVAAASARPTSSRR